MNYTYNNYLERNGFALTGMDPELFGASEGWLLNPSVYEEWGEQTGVWGFKFHGQAIDATEWALIQASYVWVDDQGKVHSNHPVLAQEVAERFGFEVADEVLKAFPQGILYEKGKLLSGSIQKCLIEMRNNYSELEVLNGVRVQFKAKGKDYKVPSRILDKDDPGSPYIGKCYTGGGKAIFFHYNTVSNGFLNSSVQTLHIYDKEITSTSIEAMLEKRKEELRSNILKLQATVSRLTAKEDHIADLIDEICSVGLTYDAVNAINGELYRGYLSHTHHSPFEGMWHCETEAATKQEAPAEAEAEEAAPVEAPVEAVEAVQEETPTEATPELEAPATEPETAPEEPEEPASEADEMAEKLKGLGFRYWEKGNMKRWYINASQLGLHFTKYNTGNIRSADFNGDGISNSECRRMLSAKTYIDADQWKIHSDNSLLGKRVAELTGLEEA